MNAIPLSCSFFLFCFVSTLHIIFPNQKRYLSEIILNIFYYFYFLPPFRIVNPPFFILFELIFQAILDSSKEKYLFHNHPVRTLLIVGQRFLDLYLRSIELITRVADSNTPVLIRCTLAFH